ncbi:MAG: transketolase [Dehalococcoidia bacterium]
MTKTLSKEERIRFLEEKAAETRESIVKLTCTAGGGHVGGGLSMTDILVALYYHVLKYDPHNPKWPERDRFILSKGHGCIALCPVLADVGYFPVEKLDTFNQLDSPFGMHPDCNKIPGVEMSTGSLGHGLSISVGVALSARIDNASHRIFCLMGDGEMDEGSIWEAAMSAAHYKLGNLVGIVDRNGLSLDGVTEGIMALEPLVQKWEGFGWRAQEVDGHDMRALLDIFEKLPPTNDNQPTIIIAKTVKGKGVSFMENTLDWHYGNLDEELRDQALAELRSKKPAGGGHRG